RGLGGDRLRRRRGRRLRRRRLGRRRLRRWRLWRGRGRRRRGRRLWWRLGRRGRPGSGLLVGGGRRDEHRERDGQRLGRWRREKVQLGEEQGHKVKRDGGAARDPPPEAVEAHVVTPVARPARATRGRTGSRRSSAPHTFLMLA